ncbi:MAG: tetratricopeptide repeat protein [Elusimicrobiota bacterium]|jgi:tetratricopeptide (TPR) repeat protein
MPTLFRAALTLALALPCAAQQRAPSKASLNSSLCSAVGNCNAAKTRALLAQGADPNNGECGGFWASWYGNVDQALRRANCPIAETLEALLDAGFDPYSGYVLRGALTGSAADVDNRKVLELFIDHGLDVTRTFGYGEKIWSAERWAKQGGHASTMELIERAGKVPPELRKARWQRKRAQREAEAAVAARLPAIEAALKAADEAKAAGKSDEVLKQYSVALATCPLGTGKDYDLKAALIAYVRTLPAAPALSEEARRHFDRALIFLKKAQEFRDYELVVAELNASILLAPWWADSYFNLGLALGKTGDYAGAIASLKLYLAAALDSPDAETVRKKILEFEVEQELAERR